MSSRVGFRFFQSARALRSPFRNPLGRRQQTVDAAPTQSTFQRLWNSPIGVKTVHFWAPVMKWALVLAGASDFVRPAENLSLTQNLALTSTGMIWTRWCFVIKPRNIMLAAVNFLLAGVGITQVTRILMYQSSQKNKPITEVVKDDAKDIAGTVKGIVKNPEGAAKKVV